MVEQLSLPTRSRSILASFSFNVDSKATSTRLPTDNCWDTSVSLTSACVRILGEISNEESLMGKQPENVAQSVTSWLGAVIFVTNFKGDSELTFSTMIISFDVAVVGTWGLGRFTTIEDLAVDAIVFLTQSAAALLMITSFTSKLFPADSA